MLLKRDAPSDFLFSFSFLGSDVTVVGYGSEIYAIEKGVKQAEKELGVSCEVIDLRTILPYDIEAIEKVAFRNSVYHTLNHLLL